MSDISNTKREVEEHESKGNPHSNSASLNDLHDRPKPGTNITEDSNGNFNAADTGITTADLGFENGTVTYGYTDSNYSVSFANTYQKATPSFGFHAQYQDDTPTRGARFTGWITDSNGNITGMNYHVQNADSDNIRITWTVFGVTA